MESKDKEKSVIHMVRISQRREVRESEGETRQRENT